MEVNTQPGMTPTSLVPEQAAHLGIGFDDLVLWIMEDAYARGGAGGRAQQRQGPEQKLRQSDRSSSRQAPAKAAAAKLAAARASA